MSDQHSISEFLDNVKEGVETPADEIIEGVVSEGMSHLRSKISEVEAEVISEAPKVMRGLPAEPPKGLADRAINTYKTRIRPAGEMHPTKEIDPEEQIVTKASTENLKAMVRSLAGMRNSGDAGKQSMTSPSGSGNVATPGPEPIITREEVEEVEETAMSMEEYREYVMGSFQALEEGRKKDKKKDKKNWLVSAREDEDEEEECETCDAAAEMVGEDVVSDFEDALLQLESRDWVSVDKLTRQLCSEANILVKDLNRLFRERHGLYPDKWIKEQVQYEECGWMPLDEVARINKVGMVYEVTFMFRGNVTRFKFFWPSASRPTHDEMQKAVEGFYPRARLLTYYPAAHQDDNYMVIVPPMKEHYIVMQDAEWEALDEETTETLETICEEVGEPVSSVVYNEETGQFEVTVADHDTGEHVEVVFEGLFGKKKTPEELRQKKVDELEKLYKHSKRNILGSDSSKEAAQAAKKVRKEENELEEDWQKVNRKDKTDGMSKAAVSAYKRENPGSKLQTAVTEKNPSGKRAKRRQSFCRRSKGQQDMHNIDCSKDPDKKICKARRRWNC